MTTIPLQAPIVPLARAVGRSTGAAYSVDRQGVVNVDSSDVEGLLRDGYSRRDDRVTVGTTPHYDLASNALAASFFVPLDSGTQTVGAGKQFNYIRLSQRDGTDCTFTVGANGLAEGIYASLTSGAGSDSTSNTYAAVHGVTNAGPGTTKAIHASALGSGTSSGVLVAGNFEVKPVATQGYTAASFSTITAGAVSDIAIGFAIETGTDSARWKYGISNTVRALPINLSYIRWWRDDANTSASAKFLRLVDSSQTDLYVVDKSGNTVTTGYARFGSVTTPTETTAGTVTAIGLVLGDALLSAGTTTTRSMYVPQNATGQVTYFGIENAQQVQADVTSSFAAYRANNSIKNAAFTLASYIGFQASISAKGASATVTSVKGFSAESALAVGTNNYGFWCGINAASNAWQFYGSGTGRSYLGGALSVGGTTDPGTGGLFVSGGVQFGTHSALAAETVTGYITIKDSGGTSRKLAVVS